MTLQTRVVGILTAPGAEWQAIAAEPADVAATYRTYVLVMAAVPAIGRLVGLSLFGLTSLGLRVAVISYVTALLLPIVAAVVMAKLAPRFGSTGTTGDALKVVAYSATPLWVAGIAFALPDLAPLATIVALAYGCYLFYLGLPVVMKTPQEQVVPFGVVSAITLLVANVLMSYIA
jgi:hypothetical protein